MERPAKQLPQTGRVKAWRYRGAGFWEGPLRNGFPLLVWQRSGGKWFWGDSTVGADGPYESKDAAVGAAERGSR